MDDDDDFGENYGALTSLSFSSFFFFLQIEARRKEVSDLERQLLKEKRKSEAFEKTVIAISDEWNQLQSAFETLLEEQNFAITPTTIKVRKEISIRGGLMRSEDFC